MIDTKTDAQGAKTPKPDWRPQGFIYCAARPDYAFEWHVHSKGGKIQNASFARYRVPRFRDLPQLETMLLDRKDLPSAGAGETPIVAVAPAIGNAIQQATGLRLRSLPMVPKGLNG